MQPMWQLLSSIIAYARDTNEREETYAIGRDRVRRLKRALKAADKRIDKSGFSFVDFLVLKN